MRLFSFGFDCDSKNAYYHIPVPMCQLVDSANPEQYTNIRIKWYFSIGIYSINYISINFILIDATKYIWGS